MLDWASKNLAENWIIAFSYIFGSNARGVKYGRNWGYEWKSVEFIRLRHVAPWCYHHQRPPDPLSILARFPLWCRGSGCWVFKCSWFRDWFWSLMAIQTRFRKLGDTSAKIAQIICELGKSHSMPLHKQVTKNSLDRGLGRLGQCWRETKRVV